MCAIITLVLIGCGGVSDKQFGSKVDGICKRSATELSAIPAPPASDLPANASYTAQVLPIVRKAVDKLKAIQAPDSKQSGYKSWISTFDKIRRLIAQQSTAAAAGDRASFNSLVEQQNTLLQENKAKAALLGFQECSK